MSTTTTASEEPEHIRAMMERVRNGDLLAFRELFSSYIDSIHLVLCDVIPRKEIIHSLERQIFTDLWDHRVDLIEGRRLRYWLRDQIGHTVHKHYIRGIRVSKKRKREIEDKLSSMLIAAFDEERKYDDREISLPLRKSLWTEVQAYIETQTDRPESWNPTGILMWMGAMLLLTVGFLYAVFNINIDLSNQGQPLSLDATPASDGASPMAPLESNEVTEADVTASTELDNVEEGGTTADQSPRAVIERNPELRLLQDQYKVLKTEFSETIDIDESVHNADFQETMEGELDLVEQSITELVGLLEENPENEFVEDMLIKTYKKQVKLLKRVTFLSE